MPRKSQFTEEQIIRALHEVDSGAKAAEVSRRLGVTEGTFYRWKSKFGGMSVPDAKRLRALEDENSRLKKLVAEQLLDIEMLRAVNRKKW
jgi:putative transposase